MTPLLPRISVWHLLTIKRQSLYQRPRTSMGLYPTPRIAMSVGWLVRNEICSYFQWEEQQQQQDRQGRRPDLHGPLVRTSLTCVSMIRAALIHVHTSWMHVPWIHASLTHVLWTHLRGSHGLSARRANRTKSRRLEGPQIRSWGPGGPLNF